MTTATPATSAPSVVPKATAATDRAAARRQSNAPSLRPNDAKLYGPSMAVMAVACPRCGAKVGKPCTEPAGLRAPHKDRIVKASGDRTQAAAKRAKPSATGDRAPAAKP